MITFRSAGEATIATTIPARPAAAIETSGHTPIRLETSCDTPFASTRISPTFSRVTNVDDIPARLRSRNDTGRFHHASVWIRDGATGPGGSLTLRHGADQSTAVDFAGEPGELEGDDVFAR